MNKKLRIAIGAKGENEAANLKAALAENPFRKWSPYDGSDMATGHLLGEFHAELKLEGWPNQD